MDLKAKRESYMENIVKAQRLKCGRVAEKWRRMLREVERAMGVEYSPLAKNVVEDEAVVNGPDYSVEDACKADADVLLGKGIGCVWVKGEGAKVMALAPAMKKNINC